MLAVLLAGSLGAGLLIQRAVLRERLSRQVEAAHEQEVSELEVLARGRDPRTGQPFNGDITAVLETFLRRNLPDDDEVFVTFVDGQLFDRKGKTLRLAEEPVLTRRWVALRAGQRGWGGTSDGPLRWLATPIATDDGTVGMFVVATFVQDDRQEIDDSLRVAAAVAALILLVALASPTRWPVASCARSATSPTQRTHHQRR